MKKREYHVDSAPVPGDATKDHAAHRNRPSAQAQPILLPKELWPTEEELPPILDPDGDTVGQLIPLLCDRCNGKHVGFGCKGNEVKPSNRMPRRPWRK